VNFCAKLCFKIQFTDICRQALKADILKDIRELFPLLEADKSANIIITTHHKPDADALGSSLALKRFLENQDFSQVKVIVPTDYGEFLKWMPGEEKVINYEKNTGSATAQVFAANYIFCLDFNSLKRINEMGKAVAASPGLKVMIDHHQDPENFDDFRLWTTQTSSTCQLIGEFIGMWKGKEAIDREIASCLYAGIMTDTGSFRFDSVTPYTHRLVADLIEKGAPNAEIHNRIYDSYSFDRLRFIGHCLHNKTEIIPELNTAIMSITAAELKEYNIQTGDTEGLVNFGLSIRGIEFSALFVDRTKLIKISFRGKGKFPANLFAKENFEGGGHYSAAGGQSTESLEKAIERFKKVLPDYKEYLIHQK
jgi:phosphoesterase RecJ-like protein